MNSKRVFIIKGIYPICVFAFLTNCTQPQQEPQKVEATSEVETNPETAPLTKLITLQPEDINGLWRFQAVKFPGVSSIDSATAINLIEDPVSIIGDSALVFNQWCELRSKQLEKVNLNQYLDDLYKTQASIFQITVDSALVVEITSDTINGDFILLNSKESLLIYNGAFFNLKKEIDQKN